MAFSPAALIRLIRPHQWVKNVLVFMPAIAGHRYSDHGVLLRTTICFAAFCLIASGNYIFNDLKDIESDRKHSKKRFRPLAAGTVTVPVAVLLGIVMLAGGLCLGWLVSVPTLAILLVYLFISNLYTFDLKKRLLVDVIALAGLYAIRPLAGGVATGIPLTPWFHAFNMFFFASLAFAKRYTELHETISPVMTEKMPGRGYQYQDMDILRVVGPVCGFMAVLVVALYVSSPERDVHLYKSPQLLWLLCPLIGFWITRIWFLCHRGVLHHDPVVFALTDSRSYMTIALAGAVVYVASNYTLAW